MGNLNYRVLAHLSKSNSSTFKDFQTQIQELSRTCLSSRTFQALKIWKIIQGLSRTRKSPEIKCSHITRARLRPYWAWCCCQERGISQHSRQTKRFKNLDCDATKLNWRQLRKAVNNPCAWLQKYWGGSRLQLALMCHHDAGARFAQPRKYRKKSLSTPWASNGIMLIISLMLQQSIASHINPALHITT